MSGAATSTSSTSRSTPGFADPLADDEVDELARDDDRLADLLAVELCLHLLGRESQLDELLVGEVDRDLEAVAQLAVHLHDELERRASEEPLARDGPRRLPETLVPELEPQLLGQVRRVRLDQRHGSLGGEARARVVLRRRRQLVQ